MEWKIEVRNRPGVFDPLGSGVEKDIEDLGISGVRKVIASQVFIISGELTKGNAKRIAEELLADPVTQEYTLAGSWKLEAGSWRVVEIAYNPGVMDPVEESTKKAIRDLGMKVDSVKTEKKFFIEGKVSERDFKRICEKLLYNKVIQHVVSSEGSVVKGEGREYRFERIFVDILSADDKKLLEISKKGQLFLNLIEMKAIRDYFKRLGRNPTDCELETLAQTWSEHCVHKTFRGLIEYNGRVINNLLKNTIMRVTKELKKPWCVSVFKDNAGVIRFDDEDNICFKVETHNHPSALEPYGGAGTGIGGVIRDILGVGLGAKPILNTDVFCFGLPDIKHSKLPRGVLHPKRILKGVVAGVRDYGNRMGIPTANGAVLFDERFTGNPLVYCGTVGIMPKEFSFKKLKKGDLVVLIGGRTGRDGIHGATFSSGELTQESEVISSSAVQIGNPITEKKLTDTLLQARDKKLYNAVTDCGGGGLSSAVGEMGKEIGVEIDLEKVPLKYEGLNYTEIWISEAQERMIMAVSEENLDELLEVFRGEDVEATCIGRFTGDKRLNLRYKGQTVADLDMGFLHEGLPRIKRKAVWKRPRHKEPEFECPKDLTPYLLKLLSSYNVCSKEWVICQYDHEVQGQSVLKPLVGIKNDGPGDACIIRPKFDSKRGVVISNGINPRYGLIDPYWMAGSCIDEALRQIIAVGGNLKRVAILDNFCWGNTNKADILGELVRAAYGCYDFAKRYGVPFISGKDSLNNEYSVDGKTISIPPTLLISAIGVMEDVTKAVSMDFKENGNLIYIVGDTYDELGGSHYYLVRGFIGNSVPKVDTKKGVKIFDGLSKATERGLIRAMHDCSEGGIGVALAEMAFAGGFGVEVFLSSVKCQVSSVRHRDDVILFSESNTRFIVEVRKKDKKIFEEITKGLPIGLIGCVSEKRDFRIYGLDGDLVVNSNIDELKEAWQKPLRW